MGLFVAAMRAVLCAGCPYIKSGKGSILQKIMSGDLVGFNIQYNVKMVGSPYIENG